MTNWDSFENEVVFGLPDKEWRIALDRYLYGDERMDANHYESMSSTQKTIIQEIKKSKKRATYINNRGNPHHSLAQT